MRIVPCPKRELTVFGVIPASKQRVANVCLKICAESLGQSNSYPLLFAFSIQYPNELLKPVRLYASPNDDTKIRSSLIDDFPLYIFPSSGFLFLMFLSSISYAVLLSGMILLFLFFVSAKMYSPSSLRR